MKKHIRRAVENLNLKKIFLKWFLIFLFITSAFSLLGYRLYTVREREHVINQIQIQDLTLLDVNPGIIADEMASVEQILLMIVEYLKIHGDLASPPEERIFDIESMLMNVSTVTGIFDQIRYIDRTGQEVLRINYNEGNPLIIDHDELQSKSGRYYFSHSIGLKEGNVYVSDLDLNVEQDEVEIPYKPMIRFASPVYLDDSSEAAGVVVLNYLAENLFEKVLLKRRISGVHTFLINSRGDYLINTENPEMEFLFMFPEEPRITASFQQPDLWQALKESDSGQLLNEKGLFTYSKLHPLKENWVSSSGSGGTPEELLSSEEYYWFLVDWHPDGILQEEIRNHLITVRSIRWYLLLAVLVFSLLPARFKAHSVDEEKKIKEMAYHDKLTGLQSRAYGLQRLVNALDRADSKQTKVAVLFADMDRFKPVNDKYGHDAGDFVLKTIAGRLSRQVRPSDTVVRLGGDEFLIVLEGLTDSSTAMIIARRIVESVKEPVVYEEVSLELGISIGIAMYPRQGDSLEDLIDHSDRAMYQAKKSGENICFYKDNK